jgi:hypothetical protein
MDRLLSALLVGQLVVLVEGLSLGQADDCLGANDCKRLSSWARSAKMRVRRICSCNIDLLHHCTLRAGAFVFARVLVANPTHASSTLGRSIIGQFFILSFPCCVVLWCWPLLCLVHVRLRLIVAIALSGTHCLAFRRRSAANRRR